MNTSIHSNHPTAHGLSGLDQHVLGQLPRTSGLTDSPALMTIERLAALRKLSGQFMNYLSAAQDQSRQMQQDMACGSSIVAELAQFVHQLPQQAVQDHAQLQHLSREVRQLALITEAIHDMARRAHTLAAQAPVDAKRTAPSDQGFAVLVREVGHLAQHADASSQAMEGHIRKILDAVQTCSAGAFVARSRHNEAERARLLALCTELDEAYVDLQQFYTMLLTAIAQHNGTVDKGITSLLDEARYQDGFIQATLSTLADGVITTNSLGCVQWLNPVAEQLCAWRAAEAIGRPLTEVFHLIERPRSAALDTESRQRHTLLSRDGSRYIIDTSETLIP